MLANPNRTQFFSSVLVIFALCAGGLNSYAQCGTYLRHASTQAVPFPKVYLHGAADMNGDGKVDLLAAQDLSGGSFSRNRLLIIPNSGNGNFDSPIVIDPPVSTQFSYQWKVGLVNNDSLNDIIAYRDYGGGQSPGTMYVYLNTGGGTFSAPVTSSAGEYGLIRELVDVNNDGKNDYVGFNGSAGYKLGNGDGTFGTPVTVSSGFGAVWAGKFNNDALMDFINSRTLYINNGDNTFTSSDVSVFFGSGVLLAIKELNGDGLSDVIVSTQTGFTILKRTTVGFDSTSYPVPNITSLQAVGQVVNADGDAFPDLIYSYRLSNLRIVFSGDASGNFTRNDFDQKFFYYNFLNKAVGDFDNDGRDDVVEMTSGIVNSSLLLSDITSITFKRNVCERPGQPRIVDFDASGNTDFSFWNPATGAWAWKANPYDGETTATETVNWGLGSLGDIPTPGDFDGDGISDRAVYRNSTGVWYIRRSSDLGWYVLPFGSPGDKPVVADYDGDTISDIAVWRPSDGNWYRWYMGTQTFSIDHFGSDGDMPAPADYDGDLKTDIGVYRPSTGVWYYLKSTNSDIVTVGWGISTDKPIPADFDGDGKADVTVFRESDRFVYIIRSATGVPAYYQWGLAGDILQIADYNGDSVADLGYYRPSTRIWSTTGHSGALFGADNVIPVSSMIIAE